MPLIQSAKPKDISKNISEFHTGKAYAHTEEKFGKERADKQAVAVALNTARKVKRAPGGQIPWFVRNEARGLTHVGPINSIVPGRTDNHAMAVPAGSYVLPSEHVASLGQGNTNAGAAVLSRMFHSGPYGSSAPNIRHGGLPKAPPVPKFAPGGAPKDSGKPVDIYAAGGEFVIPPEAIIRKFGDLDRGHKMLDAWVMHRRKKHIETLKGLKPPAKD